MSETLTGLARLCGGNTGGLTKVEYVPVDLIAKDSFEPITNGRNLQKAVVLTSGDWLTVFLDIGRQYREPFRRDVQGGRYEQDIAGNIIGTSDALEEELERMPRRRYLVRITERDGRIRLIGTPTAPLTFEYEYDTGASVADSRGYQIRFFGLTPDKSYLYNPVF